MTGWSRRFRRMGIWSGTSKTERKKGPAPCEGAGPFLLSLGLISLGDGDRKVSVGGTDPELRRGARQSLIGAVGLQQGGGGSPLLPGGIRRDDAIPNGFWQAACQIFCERGEWGRPREESVGKGKASDSSRVQTQREGPKKMSYEVMTIRRVFCDRCNDRIADAEVAGGFSATHAAVRAAGGERILSSKKPERWEDRCSNCKERP